MNRRDLLKSLAGVAALPMVKSVEVLRVQPEDTIVITCQAPLSAAAAERLREMWLRAMPSHQRVVVLDGGLDLKVVRK